MGYIVIGWRRQLTQNCIGVPNTVQSTERITESIREKIIGYKTTAKLFSSFSKVKHSYIACFQQCNKLTNWLRVKNQ